MATTPPADSSTTPITNISIDDLFSTTPIGSVNRAIGNNLYGINHRQVPGMVQSNKDIYGLTFFTRPQLNLQDGNIRNVRQLYSLLTQDSQTLQRFVRTTLDPRLMTGYQYGDDLSQSVPPIDCPLVDPENVFIPVLTNNLNSISGWPDMVTHAFTSKPGLYNEVYAQVDSTSRVFEAFDLDASFKNSRGDPIAYMFAVWMMYQSNVFEGKLVPYLDFISENEIDYNTRIYRLVLDQTKTIVTKICCTGASFPISLPTASFFDYSHDKPFNDQNKDIAIRFKCLGVDYFDDIVIAEFNQSVCIFNPGMRDDYRDTAMVKVNKNLIGYFNNRGYPRINPTNNELEWYIATDLFNNRVLSMIQKNIVTQEYIDLFINNSPSDAGD